MGLPMRKRVVVLGASNVTLSGSTLLQSARAILGRDVAFHIAAGLGRSYGERSAILGRTLPAILKCRLWEDLPGSGTGPVRALVTDIGNDILYGYPVEEIARWVEACIDRLLAVGARVVITSLPLESLRSLGPVRYHIARQIFFPTRFQGFHEARNRAERLDARVRELAANKGIGLAVLEGAWYGLDPIHIMRGRRREAWNSILQGWDESSEPRPPSTGIDGHLPSLRFAVPDERWILGLHRRHDQPWWRLADGTTISVY